MWSSEYDFDRADAEIAVPLALLVLGITLTPLNRAWLWTGGVAYYFLYFFLRPVAQGVTHVVERIQHWSAFRCPYCRSREIILQGYQGYHSDEFYAFHLCNQCKETSVLVNDRLIKTSPDRELQTA
jgi:hypothetical protein